MRSSRGMIRALRLLALVLASLLLVAALLWTYADVHYSRQLERELARLRAEGQPLSLTEAAPAVPPPEQNAATVYLKVFQVGFGAGEAPANNGLKRYELAGGRTDLQNALASRAVLESDGVNRALADLTAASLRPRCVFPLHWQDGFAMLFPHLSQFRQAARLLSLRAVLDAHEGRTAEALQRLATCERMAGHIGQEPTLIAQLVACAVRQIADEGAHQVLPSVLPDAASASVLYRAADPGDMQPQWQAALRSEIALGLWVFRADGVKQVAAAGDPGLSAAAIRLLGSRFAHPYLIVEELNYLHYASLGTRGMSVPFRDRSPVAGDVPRARPGTFIAAMLIPVYTRASIKRDEALARLGLLRAVLSLKQYRLAHSAYPDALARLAVPVEEDPFSGKSFIYRREGQGFVIYGIGPDLKDDGGKAVPDKQLEKGGDMVWRCPR